MKKSNTSPDTYLSDIEGERRETLLTVDGIIRAAMPDRSRTLWEGVFWGGTEQTIIGYGDLIQPRPRGETVEWFLIGLAQQKSHISLYVNAVEDGKYLGATYGDRLGKIKLGSASIGFKKIGDLDLDVLAELAAHAHRISPPD